MVAMSTRLPPLLDRAILFAHRGARANAREHSMEAFRLALRLGATGLHADVWLTRDGVPVLDRSGLVRRFPRRRIADVDRADLPEELVLLDDLLADVGGGVPISLGVQDPDAAAPVIATARARDMVDALWLAHASMDVLATWRDLAPEVRLVNATSLASLPFGAERRAAELAAARVDAVRLPEGEWTGGMVTLFHRFDVLAFAADAHYERQLARVIDMGCDAVISDHVDRMAAVAATFE